MPTEEDSEIVENREFFAMAALKEIAAQHGVVMTGRTVIHYEAGLLTITDRTNSDLRSYV